jgi:UrcA family protein
MNTITFKSFRILAAGAIFSALAVSFPAVSSADEPDSPPKAIVKYADLDPSSGPGAAVLYGRIYRAAEDVCSRMYSSSESYRRHKTTCLRGVIATAVVHVDEPALSALFTSKFATSPPVVLAAAQVR